MTQHILLLGATGATGRLILDEALSRGWRVTAGMRNPEKLEHSADQLTKVEVDVLKPSGISAAVEGCTAVISALGVDNDPKTLASPPPLYTDGHANVVAAMEKIGVERLVCISALWSRANDFGPLWFRAGPVMALTRVYSQMRMMERELAAHEKLQFTCVRAGYLQDDPIESAPPAAYAERPPEGHWLTRRADLARFMVDCVAEGSWQRASPCFSQADDGKVMRRNAGNVR
ncbi:NAD(P)-dependent oxidoreductase [Pontivivens insulae]|uniref:NAD(P)-binding domain-containing protein n=1 Tax=Pontivivens insulae TaxID=1639689 RepID=A0A2R8AE55_9RHOB|nr:NAD(P)H-binding protein [Pontivivens insulae]RED14260.1 putative NAD(P)-binding protein [Pontivivens insulae]SPF30335.1 hypothetical protein POI8812_02671 [Pontivivens insulae]